MCGIVGVVTKAHNGLIKRVEDSFFQMLYADAVRGEDSTGVIAVEKDTTFHIAKEAISAEWFINSLKVSQSPITNAMWNRGAAYIGHNRKKTIGKISDETAHPFVVEDTFAVVHNGTLRKHHELAPNCDVDSQALAIHLHGAFSRGGSESDAIKAELEDALGKVDGAYALAMYNQDRHRVHLLRNKERPLSVIETEDAWYFMSEPLMGVWILVRNGYTYTKLDLKHLEEHEIVTFDLDKKTMGVEKLTPKKAVPPTTGGLHIIQSSQSRGKTTTETQSNATAGNSKKGNPCKTDKELKKFRHKWEGKRIYFWTDDYLEKNFPRTVEDHGETEVTLMGEHEEISFWHTILADIDMDKLGIKYVEDFATKKWTGIIESIDVTKAGCLQIHMQDGCKPMAPSTQMDIVRVAREYKAKLGKMLQDELNTFYEENKHTMETWQVSAINGERAFRAGINSLTEASVRAKVLGTILDSHTAADGHLYYTDSEGRVYYESPVVVH